MTDDDDATVAAVFRAALTLGIATPADLVPWADGQIMARDRPAAWIIDLAMSADWAVGRVVDLLADPAASADTDRIWPLLIGLIDGVDGWTSVAASWAGCWVWKVTGGADDRGVACAADHYCEELVLSATDYPDHPDTPAVQRELTASMRELVRKHADPAARAWLPTVRVRFDGDGRHGSG